MFFAFKWLKPNEPVSMFKPEHRGEIEALLRKCDLRTEEELLNAAVTLFERAVEIVERGSMLAERNETENCWSEIRTPELEAARKNKA